MKPVRTLVVLASDGEARFLAQAGVGGSFVPQAALSREEFPDAGIEYTDRPGRGMGAAGVGRHGMPAHGTVQEVNRAAFARHVAAAVQAEWAKGDFDRILLAAAPRMLGELREVLPAGLRDMMLAEIDKDLVKVPVEDLARHLGGVLAV